MIYYILRECINSNMNEKYNIFEFFKTMKMPGYTFVKFKLKGDDKIYDITVLEKPPLNKTVNQRIIDEINYKITILFKDKIHKYEELKLLNE